MSATPLFIMVSLPVRPDVHAAIVRAANENNIDPSLALAIADRESSGNVNGGAPGSSAYGLFQLLRSERNTYGGNSQDPYEQATAWAHYIKGTKDEMAARLGRDPTGPELYLGHYWGGTRAAKIVSGQIPGQTPVQSVFSPQELAVNPNLRGTAGALSSSIMADIGRRTAKYAGAGAEPTSESKEDDFNPAKWGTPVGSQSTAPTAPAPTGGPIQSSAPVPYTNPEPAPIAPPPQQQNAAPPMPPPMAPPGGPVPYTSGQSIVG